MASLWRLLALAPMERDGLQSLFGDLPVDVRLPAERTPAAVTDALPGVDLVLGDWTGRLGLSGEQVAVADRLAFVQQPSVGVDLIDVDGLARLPSGAVVVNAARGAVLDEDALLDAIQSGHLTGAALDVYPVEPLPPDSPLRGEDRILLSPHVAGASPESRQRLLDDVASNVGRAVRGEPLQHVVNRVDPVVRRRA